MTENSRETIDEEIKFHNPTKDEFWERLEKKLNGIAIAKYNIRSTLMKRLENTTDELEKSIIDTLIMRL